MSDFIIAYDQEGKERRVPAHWFDIPALSQGLTKTKPTKPSAPKPTAGKTEKEA